MTILRTGLLVAACLAMPGCGIFGGEDDDALAPKELVDFEPTLKVERLWSAKVGGKSEFLRLNLVPAGDGTRIYTAGRDGSVSAFDPESGRRLWRTETDAPLSAGPGLGNGRVVVAASDGTLISLVAETGEERWRVNIGGESLATPIIARDSLVVYTIDGKLRVLSLFNGNVRWSMEQSVPALTLRGSAAPVVVGTTIIAGFDNGRLVAVNLLDGATEWEAMLSPPTGRSDLERLSDVDGTITAVDQDVYASGYQGRIASVAAESGQVLWAREVSTHVGVSADWNNLYTANNDGEILAMSRNTGAEAWRNDALLRREPTLPVPFDTAVVAADFEGYLHFMSNLDGDLVARERVGKGMVSGAPVVIGGRLYVQTEAGKVSAYAVPKRDAPAAPGEE
ncbi:MAG: outer membrane protein assembly factor BamB [Woeseia sp.]